MPLESSRLTVGVVGLGRAGTALAAALQNAGHSIIAIHSTAERSKQRAQQIFPQARICSAIDVVKSAQLVLLTVPDDELAGLVSGLARAEGFSEGQYVVHCAGRFGLLPLLPAIDQGAVGLALHPAMTFIGDDADVRRLQNCPFAITAATQYRAVAQALVIEMGGEPIWVDDANRTRYHAALSHAANHLQTLIAQSENELRAIGVSDPAQLLAPLTTTALENVLSSGISALTGPISRGDAQTVAAHLAEVSSDVRQTYRVLAAATVNLLEARAALKPNQVAQLRAVLES